MLFDLERPPPLHKGYRGHILYLDFDGVLHPDDVWRTRGRGIHLGDKSSNHQLFESAELLCAILEPFPRAEIVLSTTWVRIIGFNAAASYLPASLRRRVIGATYHSAMPKEWFLKLDRGEQVLKDIERRQPERWVAVDDAKEGWTTACAQHLVLCNGEFGLSEQLAQAALLNTLAANFSE